MMQFLIAVFVSTLSATAMPASSVEARIETYCLDEARTADGSGKFAACILRQGEAEKQIAIALERGRHDEVSRCSGFTTGLRGLGSMENIDMAPVARCLRTPDAKSMFAACVQRITGKPWTAEKIFWKRDEAELIAACFNVKTELR